MGIYQSETPSQPVDIEQQEKSAFHGGDFRDFLEVYQFTLQDIPKNEPHLIPEAVLKQIRIMKQEMQKIRPIPFNVISVEKNLEYYQERGIQGNPLPRPDVPPRFDSFASLVESLDAFETLYKINPQDGSPLARAYTAFRSQLAYVLTRYGVATYTRDIRTLPMIEVKEELKDKEPRSFFDPQLENLYQQQS